MRVLFATFRDHYPYRLDGAILSAHALLQELHRRGHACEAVVSVSPGAGLPFQLYRAARAVSGRRIQARTDRVNGYRTHRAWATYIPTVLERRIRKFAPDVVLTQLEGSAEIARRAAAAAIPCMAYIVDAEFWWQDDAFRPDPRILPVSISRYVSQRVRERLGVQSPVLYPIVLQDAYVADRRRPRFVTMVNPVREKGVDIAIEVAKLLPHREFLFVETWPLDGEQGTALKERLVTAPNVTLEPVCRDMRRVYARTALLLAPSQWEEAFGRVILEAHANGIPVVASRRGGIPEVLRTGGTLLEPSAAPAEWAEAVEALLSETHCYETASAQARQNAAREEFEPAAILGRFLTLAAEHRRSIGAARTQLVGGSLVEE